MSELRNLNCMTYDTASGTTVCTYGSDTVCYHTKPYTLIEQWCLMHGSTMQGRQDAFRTLTGTVQKPAVLVGENGPLLMPSASARSEDCVWLAYDNILHIHAKDAHTEIVFLDGTRTEVHVDVRIIRTQYKRCTVFREQLQHPSSIAAEEAETCWSSTRCPAVPLYGGSSCT